MVFRRRNIRRRRYGVRKAIGKARYTRKPKAIVNAVSAVNKKINRIAKAMPQANRLYYGWRQTSLLDQIPTPYTAYNIMRFAGWSRIFGTGAEDENVRTAHMRSARIQHYITHVSGADLDTIQQVSYTYFLVKLTKKGSYLLDESTGELKTLLSNQHYFSTDQFGVSGLGGQTMLNKQFFKILKYKKFVLGNMYQALVNGGVQTQGGLDRRWDDKVSFKFDVSNPNGNWRDTLMPQNPQQNIFSILFCDNVQVDREPRWSSSMVLTCDTY